MITRPGTAAQAFSTRSTQESDSSELPDGLDPVHHRIILLHWFGRVIADPRTYVGEQDDQLDLYTMTAAE